MSMKLIDTSESREQWLFITRSGDEVSAYVANGKNHAECLQNAKWRMSLGEEILDSVEVDHSDTTYLTIEVK